MTDSFSVPKLLSSITISLLTAGLGIIGHEYAHKYVAQRYGCKAQYQANKTMLNLSLLLSFAGVLFLAPGAVIIKNIREHDVRNGKIASAGPSANLLLSLVFVLLGSLLVSVYAIETRSVLYHIVSFGARINAYIALFNLLPISIIDGKKILSYSKKQYALLVVSGVILVIISASLF